MRVTDHLEMLVIKSANSTYYPTLLWDDEDLVLVDACLPAQTDLLDAAVREAGFDIKSITKIILTHQDLDHIGCVRDLLAVNPDVQVIAHEAEAPYIDGRETPIKIAAREAGSEDLSQKDRAAINTAKINHSMRTVPVGKTVTAGELLPCCGGIKIIHTPGHTPGHICLYIKEGGVLIAGDGLNLNDNILSGPNPIHTFNMEQAVDSLRQLKHYDIKKVIAYHGGLYEGPFQTELKNIAGE